MRRREHHRDQPRCAGRARAWVWRLRLRSQHLYPNDIKIAAHRRLMRNKATLDALTAGEDPRRIAEDWQDALKSFRDGACEVSSLLILRIVAADVAAACRGGGMRFRASGRRWSWMGVAALVAAIDAQLRRRRAPVHLDRKGERWAAATLRKMTLEEKIGQMIVVWAKVQFMNVGEPGISSNCATRWPSTTSAASALRTPTEGLATDSRASRWRPRRLPTGCKRIRSTR